MNDPKVKVLDALTLTGGNQSALAGILGVTRGAVSQWVVEKREYLPALQAYRLKDKYPDVPEVTD